MNKTHFYDERSANTAYATETTLKGAAIAPRDPVLCKVQKTMTEAGMLLAEFSEWADRLCGLTPEVPHASGEKCLNGFFDGISNDADSLMGRVIEARAAISRIRREFP